MLLLIRAMIGALVVVLISLVSKTSNFFIAALIPLFPTFALISQYIVGTERSSSDLKSTALFGMLSLIPYFFYLLTVYLLVDKYKLIPTLLIGVGIWLVIAGLLVYLWK